MPAIFTSEEVQTLVQELTKAGMHPAKIRRRLGEQGIRWAYQFSGSGRRERLRRLKRRGMTLCGCGGTRAITATLCPACLDKKWKE